ncbi:MAG: hypothetical protein AAGH15_00685 [Myxococcota bacterium]
MAEVSVYGPLFFLGLAKLAAPTALASLESPAQVGVSLFAALATVAVVTRQDFAFLRRPLVHATAAALVLVVVSALAQRPLGVPFTYAMVALAALGTLEHTAAALRGWRPLPYVGPALRLLARPVFAPVPSLGAGLTRLAGVLLAPVPPLNRTLTRVARHAFAPVGWTAGALRALPVARGPLPDGLRAQSRAARRARPTA